MLNVDVAVVGAGYTGAALVIELAARLPRGARIALIDPREEFGRGVAYGTPDLDHRLNVPAGRMSLFADDADDFVRWLGEQGDLDGWFGGGSLADAFAPRPVYGRYVAERLAAAEQGHGVTVLRVVDRAVDVTVTAHGYRLVLAETQPLQAARLALCLGNAPCGLPVPPAAIARTVRDRIVLNPWAAPGIAEIDPDEDLLFVGTGLTMIDQVVTLARRGHRGRLVAMSRRGLLPVAHSTPRPEPVEPEVPAGATLLELVRALRRQAAAHVAAGGDWQAVFDGLRPLTQALWGDLGTGCRRRFLRHFAPYWGIMRHRMAPEIAARVAELRRSGGLEIVAGRVLALGDGGGRVGVEIRRRGRQAPERLVVDRIVNCAGLDRGSIAACDPLVAALVLAGLARSDPLGLGLDVDEGSRLIRRDGGGTATAHALGPLTVGRFWEIVAVPDIRVQCRDVAIDIAAGLDARRPAAAHG